MRKKLTIYINRSYFSTSDKLIRCLENSKGHERRVFVGTPIQGDSYRLWPTSYLCPEKSIWHSYPKLEVAAVFELPGGWGGSTPPPPTCLLNPPKQDALGYPGGSVSTPPPLLMLSRLCVMTMNRQMSTPPTYFLTVQTLSSRISATRQAE
jgi:hypothetical protein